MRSDRREATLRSWRARHVRSRAADPLPQSVGGRVRRRHRAPTPRLPRAAPWRSGQVRRWLAATVVVCGLAALAGAVWRAPALRVSHATVVGNRRLSAQSIYAAAALDGRHILAIDYRRAERAIGDLGGVATARVRPHPPGGIRIVVSETPLVVAWLARDASAAVDAEGSVVALSSADGLLRVTSNSPMPLDDAGRIPADVLDAALAYGQRFGDLAYDPATGFAARLPEGATLRLGTEARRLPQQLAMLDAMLARIPVGTQSVETIDLRFPNRPYYRTAEGAP